MHLLKTNLKNLAGTNVLAFSQQHQRRSKKKVNNIDTSGLYYKLITIVIDAARSDAPNWSVTLMIVIDDAS
jgi:hypothetical protein